jgi:hypothetical protein
MAVNFLKGVLLLVVSVFLIGLGAILTITLIFSALGIPLLVIGIILLIVSILNMFFGTLDAVLEIIFGILRGIFSIFRKPVKKKSKENVIDVEKKGGVYQKK